jgi:hypothetical protein
VVSGCALSVGVAIAAPVAGVLPPLAGIDPAAEVFGIPVVSRALFEPL